jgi:hypothetical protein
MRATKVQIWRIIYIVTSIATVVGAIAEVGSVLTNRTNAHSRDDSGRPLSAAASPSPNLDERLGPPQAPLPTAPPAASDPPREKNTGAGERPEPRRADRPTLPLDFTLRDGEQRTFLRDQASVSAEFNQIGSEEVVTLRIGTTKGESVPHAVLGAGTRFPVHVKGSSYSVYVLRVDKTARTIGVRISRDSDSQEKGGQ